MRTSIQYPPATAEDARLSNAEPPACGPSRETASSRACAPADVASRFPATRELSPDLLKISYGFFIAFIILVASGTVAIVWGIFPWFDMSARMFSMSACLRLLQNQCSSALRSLRSLRSTG